MAATTTFEARRAASARQVEARSRNLLHGRGTLANAMRYAALGAGKRLRPFLLIESAALFNVPRKKALNAAVALECVHCYSLVHDDLPAMDDDDLRRGKPSVHRAFNEATAILAGDALLTLAFELLSDSRSLTAAQRAELSLMLARAAGWQGMVQGQQLDLEAETGTLKRPVVARVPLLKTAGLFRFAAEAGAVIGNAPARERKALAAFGQHLGIGFQLADDLADETKDARDGKTTLVALLGRPAVERLLAREAAAAKRALARFGTRAGMLREAVHFITAATAQARRPKAAPRKRAAR